jgi:hypothetical protein
MAKGIDWRRARAPKSSEDAMGEGFERRDGTVTRTVWKGGLAKRAAAAEREWLKTLPKGKKTRKLRAALEKPMRK